MKLSSMSTVDIIMVLIRVTAETAKQQRGWDGVISELVQGIIFW